MDKLLLKVKNIAHTEKITNKMIATKLSVSEGMITNYLNGTNRISGNKFADIISMICENRTDDIEHYILEYADKINKEDFIVELIEWCHHADMYYLQLKLLNKFEHHTNPIFFYYRLLSKRDFRNITPIHFYLDIINMKYKSNKIAEYKAIEMIALLYANYDLHNFNMLFIVEEALKNLTDMKNKYLKESYKYRVLTIQTMFREAINNG